MKIRNFRSNILSTLVIALLLLNSNISAGSQKVNDQLKALSELKIQIDELLKTYEIPGAGIALVTKDSIIWAGGIGMANAETNTPVSKDTYFRLASITKSFLSLGFLKMVEDGLIDLNTPIRELIPEIKINNPWQETDPVRVVHLLEHSSGFDDIHLYEYFNINDDPQIPLLQVLKKNPNLRKVRFRPGSKESYSNHAYVVAGYILEKLAGMRFEDYLLTNIIRPIGMKTSAFNLNSLQNQWMSQGYTDLVPTPFRYSYTRPASSLISSPEEMGLFVQFLLNKGSVNGKQLINEGLIDRMETKETTIAAESGLRIGSGLGLEIQYKNGIKHFGHSGMIPGYYVRFGYNRELGIGCVVLMNSSGTSGSGKIYNMVLDYMIDGKNPPPKQVIKLSQSQLEKFSGHYDYTTARGQLFSFADYLMGGMNIYARNDTLFYKEFMGEETPLLPVAENMFRRLTEPDASIVFGKSDNKDFLIDDYFFYEKNSPWKQVISQIFVLLNIIIILSSVVFALVWIPVYVYQKIRNRDQLIYIQNRIFPLFAILALILGIIAFSRESMDFQIGYSFKTFGTITFFISTLLFALFSFLGLIFAIRSFKKPVKAVLRIYFLIVSISYCAMTIYLWINDVIGLRFWAY